MGFVREFIRAPGWVRVGVGAGFYALQQLLHGKAKHQPVQRVSMT